MLVVAPLAIITVAVVVTAMVSMIGDSISSYTRAENSYDIQNTLDRIEKDARISSGFIGTFSAIPAGQGRNADDSSNKLDATKFDATVATSNDLILNQTASTSNPYDSARNIVYYAKQPNDCNTSTTYLNRPLSVKVAYFAVKDPSPATTSTLWRRVFVPPYNQNASVDTQTVCDSPWQRPSCPTLVNANCKAIDERLLSNVTNFAVTYYDASGNAIAASAKTNDSLRNAVNVKVDIKVQEKSAGNSVETSGTARATRTNGVVDQTPVAPQPYIYSPSDNTANNPVKTTIAWLPVPYAGYYSISYTINRGGTIITKTDTTQSPSYEIATRPSDTLNFSVTAANDMGTSPAGTLSYAVPLWTVANLLNGWECYSPASAYDCPSYTLTKSNLVVVRGTAKNPNTTSSTTMFGFPPGLNPWRTTSYATQSVGAFARVDATWASDVVRQRSADGTDGWLALDSIRFIPESLTSGVTRTDVPSFLNGWQANMWGRPEYMTDAAGRYYIHGLVNGGTGSNVNYGTSIYAIPAGSRPSAWDIWPAVSYFSFGDYHIDTNGNIATRGRGSTWEYSLASIFYPGTTTTFTALPNAGNTWANYGGSYTTAGYNKSSSDNMVFLRGLIKPTTAIPAAGGKTTLSTLPTSYCPAKSETFTVVASTNGGIAGEVPARIDISAWNGSGCTLDLIGNSHYNSSTVTAPTSAYISLSGISWLQEK